MRRFMFLDDHLILALILIALLFSIQSLVYPRPIISINDDEDNNSDNRNNNDGDGREVNDDNKEYNGGNVNDGDSRREDVSELNLIEICCSWSEEISDGVLEYSINDDGGDEGKRQALLSAITEWNNKINDLQLVNNAVDEGSKTDIEIEFGRIGDDESNDDDDLSSRGYAPGGETQIDVNEEGFINHIEITISESIFGHDIDQSELEQIAKHEIGHALGLGHANFDSNLMSVTTDIGTGEISGCELYAVLAANQWKLMNSKDQPEYPHGRYVVC